MSQSIIAIFQGIASYIQELRETLERDGVVEAELLDERVHQLSAQINALPLEERLAYKDQLGELHSALKTFEEELQFRRQVLRKQLSGITTHSQANTAYRSSYGSHSSNGHSSDE